MKDHPELFLSLLPIMWVTVCFVLSRNGWRHLVKAYVYQADFNGKWLGMFSGVINGVNYKNVISIWYNSEGIYLRPALLFRLFHRPILVPWNLVRIIPDPVFFNKNRNALRFKASVDLTIYLSGSNAMEIEQYIQHDNRRPSGNL